MQLQIDYIVIVIHSEGKNNVKLRINYYVKKTLILSYLIYSFYKYTNILAVPAVYLVQVPP